jgi:hypothetical protein
MAWIQGHLLASREVSDGRRRQREGWVSSDRISLLISLLALLASGVTLYYQFWQGPLVRAYPSRVVYLSKSNQIGIPVSFTNSGAAADIIIDGSIDLTPDTRGPSQTFGLGWISPFEQKVTYADGKWTEAARAYLPFTGLPLKTGDVGVEVFWFNPPSGNFSFQPGRYTACAHFVSAGKGSVPSGAKSGQSKSRADCSSFITFNLDSHWLDLPHSGSQDSLGLDAADWLVGDGLQQAWRNTTHKFGQSARNWVLRFRKATLLRQFSKSLPTTVDWSADHLFLYRIGAADLADDALR